MLAFKWSPEGVRGEVWRPLGGQTRKREAFVPVFWDPLGAILGRFLGPSWRLSRRLGAILVILDPQKSMQKSINF